MSDLTYQQRLVFDRIFAHNEKFFQLNGDIKSRASFITTASTAIVGIITAAKFLPSSNVGEGHEFILLSLVCLCSVGIYWFAALVWKGVNTDLPGACDIDILYNEYISKDIDTAYCNALKDLCCAFEKNKGHNATIGRLLDRIVYFFIAQLSLLAISIGSGSVAGLL